MKVHSDVLTAGDFYQVLKAERGVGGHLSKRVELDPVKQSGSRSRERGFNLGLGLWEQDAGHRRRRGFAHALKGTTWAATYDEWGFFLAALYELDPEMRCDYYEDRDDFNAKTNYKYAPNPDADSQEEIDATRAEMEAKLTWLDKVAPAEMHWPGWLPKS